jgi:hypothetical protein
MFLSSILKVISMSISLITIMRVLAVGMKRQNHLVELVHLHAALRNQRQTLAIVRIFWVIVWGSLT